MFERITAAYGEHPALAVKRHGEWKEWTYHKYYDDCVIAAKALIEVHVNCTSVVIMASSCHVLSVYWTDSFLAERGGGWGVGGTGSNGNCNF